MIPLDQERKFNVYIFVNKDKENVFFSPHFKVFYLENILNKQINHFLNGFSTFAFPRFLFDFLFVLKLDYGKIWRW